VNARWYASVVAVGALAACVGTADSLHVVRGEAPEAGDCEVAVTEAGNAHRLAREKVRGTFAVDYTLGGPFPRNVDIAAYCNGVKVKELRSVSPRGVGDADLGKLAP
jgi:hypothetical protein